MFIACGLFFALFAQKYDFGTAQRMGPAYFPTVLGAILALIGVVVSLKGLSKEDPEGKIAKFNFKEVGWVLGSVVVYGMLLVPAGAMLAIVALVVVSMMGSHEFKWNEFRSWRLSLILGIAMAVMTWCVFVWGLGVTIPVWPAFIGN
jgi:uncharacterized membrane protein